MRIAEAVIRQKYPTAYIKFGLVFRAKECLGTVAEVFKELIKA